MPRERHGGRPTASTSSPTPRSSYSSSSSSRSSSKSPFGSSSSSSSWPSASSSSSSSRPSASRTTSSRSSEKSSTPSSTPSYSSSGSSSSSSSSGSSPFFDGFSWGSGEGLGRRIGEAVFGPRTVKVEVSEASPAAAPVAIKADPSPVDKIMGPSMCNTQAKSFLDCLGENEADISKCQFYMDMLCQCKKTPDSKLVA